MSGEPEDPLETLGSIPMYGLFDPCAKAVSDELEFCVWPLFLIELGSACCKHAQTTNVARC